MTMDSNVRRPERQPITVEVVTGDAQVEAIKRRMPRPGDLCTQPDAVHPGNTATFTVGHFHQARVDDPRLAIYAGHSREADGLRIGWVLLGAVANITSEHMAPRTVRNLLTNPNAIRALELLAVDQAETHEAAVEALTDPVAVRQIGGLANAAYLQHSDAPQLVEVGVTIYALTRAHRPFANVDADMICTGAPIWIRGATGSGSRGTGR